MKIFLAGATGVIGIRLPPLLLSAGHCVAGMTRTPSKAEILASLGGEPVVADVYDARALTKAVVGCAPDAVMHPGHRPARRRAAYQRRRRRQHAHSLPGHV